MSQRGDPKVSFLEILDIFVLNQLFNLFNFLSLIGTKCLDINLFENFLLDIVNISTYWHFVNLWFFSFKSMTEVIDKLETL